MTESLPSKNAAILDVPNVQGLAAEFQYNYWTKDEFENGLGSTQAAAKQLPSETFDATHVDKTRRLPRLVKLTWRPVVLNPDIRPRVSIQANLGKLHSEETFTNLDYTTLEFQDNGLDLKLKFFADQLANQLPEFAETQSANELIALLNQNTNDQVTASFLAEIISDLSKQGVLFQSKQQASTSILSKIREVSLSTRVSNRLLVPVINTARGDSVGVFADELSTSSFLKKIQQVQDAAVANSSANLFSPNDFEFEVLSYVGIRPLDTNGYQPVAQSVGYIIEKREVKSDGTEQIYPSLVVEDPRTFVTYDGKIRYGSSYFYKIRSVFLVEARSTEEETGQNLLVSFLVGSRLSSEVEVQTVEMVPPPPPADFNLAWDFGERALRCTWSLPTNPQQDIKYIQLFRRKSIYDPFQLIKMWDFNDTNTIVPLAEYPLPELVVKTKSFVGIYLDREFSKDANYIYAVAAVDAHGLTSNYSMQLQATFDKFANKLVKKLISVSGAPKQYPNAYLNADTFVDTMKDSGHTTMRVVFNPEYLKLLKDDGTDLGLLKTDRQNGLYRIQLINIDLQSQQTVDVTIEDSRKSAKEPKPNSSIPGAKNTGRL
ncbi:MAG: hypothetical protein E6R04_02660 [Spirochaetes bacterium]|nr:MAG: hypothetical protein E6R04_02660 [Spirochaetota bacterium]